MGESEYDLCVAAIRVMIELNKEKNGIPPGEVEKQLRKKDSYLSQLQRTAEQLNDEVDHARFHRAVARMTRRQISRGGDLS